MDKRVVGSIGIAVAMAAALSMAQVAAQDGGNVSGTQTAEGKKAGPVPRTADGKPNFEGFWQTRNDVQITNKIEEHPGGYAIRASKSWVVDPPDGKIPYQEWARKERDARGKPENDYDDPEPHCFPSGVPRQMYVMPYQILQPKGNVVILYEYIHARRIIPFNTPHLPEGIRPWEGDSLAHWDGDALVVETTNNNGRIWLELGGDFIGRDTKVVEKFTMTDANTLMYEATMTDPSIFTRPWTIRFPVVRINNKGMEILESACHEDNRDLDHLRFVKESAQKKGGAN